MIHTIIFDVGDTLVKAPDLFKTISKKIRTSYNLDVNNDLIKEFNKLYWGEEFKSIKTILNEITSNILQKYNIKETQIDSSKIYKNLFLNKSELYEEVKEILNYLRDKKIRLIILSDADSDVLIPELNKLEIKDYFSDIIISSDIKSYKTSKKIIEKISPRIKGSKEGILLVGDKIQDIKTAEHLKIKSVFVNRTDERKEGDVTISSLLEIKNLLN